MPKWQQTMAYERGSNSSSKNDLTSFFVVSRCAILIFSRLSSLTVSNQSQLDGREIELIWPQTGTRSDERSDFFAEVDSSVYPTLKCGYPSPPYKQSGR